MKIVLPILNSIAFMDKSSVEVIKQYITDTVKKGRVGFYCLIDKDNTVLDVLYAFINKAGSDIRIQLMGTPLMTTINDLAEDINAEANIIDFLCLDDVLLPQHREKTG